VDLGLRGKRALVTGSSSGIGAGIAQMLAAESCAVFVHGRDEAKCRRVAAEIGAAGIAVGDLATDEGARAVAAEVGKVDILVNNVGLGSKTSAMQWLEVSEADWLDTFQVNTMPAVRMIRLLLPAMKDSGWGRIINIASTAGSQPIAYGPDYSAAKGALLNLTVSLAKSLGACGVTVNSVSPGVILTPMVEDWLSGLRGMMGWGDVSLKEAERLMTQQIVPVPVGKIGRVEDIGHVVCMIASPAAGYMMGANVRVDGGQVQSVN
jgi:3-oxoacyl-[acyl-carrier protein] reductase